jgi:archaellum component FlaC
MPDEPPSQMIRVPTPLVDAVRELSRLHRQGRTKAVLERIEKLVAAIDSETDIDIDSVSQLISKLTERLERLESDRLEKLESDVSAIALTIQDLSTRVSGLEGAGDIGYAVTPISELEAPTDISPDINETAKPSDQSDITTDSEAIAEAEPPNSKSLGRTISGNSSATLAEPHTQVALAARLGCSDSAVKKHRRQGAAHFEAWTRDRDPDGVGWRAEGEGKQLNYYPIH